MKRKNNGRHYERQVAQRLANAGFMWVQLTKPSSDYGADIICYDGLGRMVVQCKYYHGKVGVSAVQEVAAARQYYKAVRAAVATNSTFTKNAVKLARACGVELWERFI